VSALLQALPPSLTELRLALQCDDAHAAALALPSLPALARLHLEVPCDAGGTAVQPGVAAWLARMSQLRAFSWYSPGTDLSTQLVGSIGSLSGLTTLHLQVASEDGQAAERLPGVLGALAGLTALQDLACDATLLAPELIAAAASMLHLTALLLGGLPEEAPLVQLTTLSKLCTLSLSMAEGVGSVLELPAPALFPTLARFKADTRGQAGQFQVEGMRLTRCMWDGRL
jgi:hypothetical protein